MSLKDKKNLTKIERLLINWEEACRQREISEDEPRIKIHQIIKKLGWGYEKLRIVVEGDRGHNDSYKAIRRILRRLSLLEKRKPEKIPQLLIEELIRGNFLKNNKVPKSDIKAVLKIFDKYVVVMNKISVKISQIIINKKISKKYAKKRKREINRWIVSLAAREIEKFLLPKSKEEALTKSLYEYMVEQIDIDDKSLSEHDKKVQIYIAINRAFLQTDDGILNYYLFNLHCPRWQNSNEDDLEMIARKIFKLKENIAQQLNHPIRNKLRRLCAKHVVYFVVLSDILNEIGAVGFTKLIKDKKELNKKITEAVKKSYKKSKKRVRRGLFKNTLYIFITKSIMVEYPISQGFEFSILELLCVLFAGPITMLIVGFSITSPPKKNTEKIVKVFNRMIFEDKIRTTKYEIRQVSSPLIKNLIFAIVYLATFVAIIFGIYKILGYFGISAIIISITLFFFSMISYFGFRLRAIVREYVVLDRKENFFGFLFDFISLPILTLGQNLAHLIKWLNLSRRFLDYVVEVPYKIFVNFFEHWTIFVKEKKEDLDKGDY
jgi:hypothetical protein